MTLPQNAPAQPEHLPDESHPTAEVCSSEPAGTGVEQVTASVNAGAPGDVTSAKTPSSAAETEARKKKFVDRIVQGTMLRRIVAHWSVYLTVTFLLGMFVTVVIDPFGNDQPALQRCLKIQGPSLALALVLLPVFVLDTLRLTHRIAGPMLRVRRELARLSKEGTAHRIKFRPNDFWHEIGDEFNAMCDRVEQELAPAVSVAPERTVAVAREAGERTELAV